MSNMENSSDDVLPLSPEPGILVTKQKAEQGKHHHSKWLARQVVAGWDSGPQLGCCRGVCEPAVEAMPSLESAKF